MEYYNLTTPQKNIWNLQRYYEDTAIANLCGAVFYQEKRETGLLKGAVNRVIQKQTALRLRFVRKDGEEKQYIKEYSYVDIPIHKFKNEKEFEMYSKAFAIKPIGLLERTMFRFEIVVVGDKTGVLAVLSHLISDAWTFSILINEIDKEYKKIINNEISCECIDYIQYVKTENEYFKSSRFEKDKLYWDEKYLLRPENAPIKSKLSRNESIAAKRIVRKIPIELAKKIEEYCTRTNISPAVLFETALCSYLIKINYDNQSITIGLPVLNRVKAYEKDIMGMFVSTIPLTVAIEENDSVKDIAKKITKEHMNLFRHQKYPYSMIVESLREKYKFEGNLYDVMFSYQNAKTDTESYTSWYSNGYSEVPFTLHVDNRDNGDTYTVNIDYQINLFRDEREVHDIANRLQYILEQIIENENVLVKEISIMPEAERYCILNEFNDTKADYPKDKCIHELFMEQAKKTPDKVALVFEEKEITYRQLDETSNSLAYSLRQKGIGRNSVIPIIAERSWHVIVAILGVLKAGGAYLPIDPNYPIDRVKLMIADVNAKVVLAYKQELSYLCDMDIIDLRNIEYREQPEIIENINIAEDSFAVIFTSGTTGVPKGVVLKHKGGINYIYANDALYLNGKCVVAMSIINFDAFFLDTIGPMIRGVKCVLANENEQFSTKHFIKLIKRNEKINLFITPTKLKKLLEGTNEKYFLNNISSICIGGEMFPSELYEELIINNSEMSIYNVYGPTETTMWVNEKKIINKADITIGKPIANTQIYILDKQKNPVPIGVSGELCIAGDGVGLGYLNRPDLTAERFVANPFATEENGHGKIMYHTGDLAAWRENGEIEYLGRIDTQVKIRGLRIELGEIESVMSEFPGIRMCAVADKKDEEGRQYLVGYYTTTSDEKDVQNLMTTVKIDEKELRKYLASKLPKYMVPNYFMHISNLPMTPSGKTDRKNLPMPKINEITLQEYIKPITEQEGVLCNLMEEVLGYEPIGREHDFFDCGGDSLKAMEFIVRAENEGIRLQLQDIFDYPTVAELIELLQEEEQKKIEDFAKEYNSERFKKYHSLLENNKEVFQYDVQQVQIKSVLLSGITGFLGAHIADKLLQDDDCVIYCLVRSNRPDDRRGRLSETLKYYFGNKYTDLIGTRIIPIVGDITKEKLSSELPEYVDMVIHAAATVKHYGSYEYFYNVNVLGTKHMAEYASQIGAPFIHISTLSVSGNSFVDNYSIGTNLEVKDFNETSLYQGQILENVYVRSKFEAECVVLDAMLQGLKANIIRVGNLTNRSTDYMFQPNYNENAFLSRIRAVLELECLPDYIMSLNCEFSPIDDTADAIVKIAKHFNTGYTVFHVCSDQKLYFDRMIELLKQLNFNMESVSKEIFNKRLKESIGQNKDYVYKAFMNDMNTGNELNYNSNIYIQNKFTISYLKQLGFEWTKIDYSYLKGYIEYFQQLEYFKRGKTDEK